MSSKSKYASQEGSLEAVACLQRQNDEFCRRLRAAIENGIESCPTGVSTELGTQRPVRGYQRPD
jgi:hypothetical protein